MSHLSEQLDRFLALPPDCGQTLNLDSLRRFPIVFWGASDLGREALRLTRGVVDVAAFTDSDPCKWGKTFEGLPVLSPHEAKTRFKQATFVVTVYNGLVVRRRFQDEGGFQFVSFSQFILNFPQCLPFVLLDRAEKLLTEKDEIRRGLSIWSDHNSIEEYVYQIGHRLMACSVPTPRLEASELYFPPFLNLRLRRDESFCDCGAFDGDTLLDFLRRTEGEFADYVAYEPDSANFSKLSMTWEQLPSWLKNTSKVLLVPFGVSDSDEQKRFSPMGNVCSRIDASGDKLIECRKIDSEYDDGSPLTFLKMDIEGAEPDALRGAEQTIRRCKPILAISLYHAQNHLWTIPLWVHDLGLGYRLYLRRHGDDCWESVLYAIPEGR